MRRHSSVFFAWLISLVAVAVIMLFKYRLATVIVSIFPAMDWTVVQVAKAISHYLVGLFAAVHIVLFDRMRIALPWRLPFASRCIRYLAARTFSLYLYQAPLLFFFGAVTYEMKSPLMRLLLVITGSLIAILALAEVTENRKKCFSSFVALLIPKAFLARRRNPPSPAR